MSEVWFLQDTENFSQPLVNVRCELRSGNLETTAGWEGRLGEGGREGGEGGRDGWRKGGREGGVEGGREERKGGVEGGRGREGAGWSEREGGRGTDGGGGAELYTRIVILS